jgi:hypothetical protein
MVFEALRPAAQLHDDFARPHPIRAGGHDQFVVNGQTHNCRQDKPLAWTNTVQPKIL